MSSESSDDRPVLRWSVSVRTEGDRVVELDEVVALADAVAPMGGIASGIGTRGFGAQIIVEAEGQDEALELAIPRFEAAVEAAGLPAWPVTWAEVEGEDDFGDVV